ncbi:unnamed protein product [Rotaria magnacalcarata]|uniref:Uncharacterized protein n=3 Tax=Rotaria magnacalcarata TaxID=392030 RepID=A0A816SGN9_9BILA|nr:unnamed protein product [Rotaria magnacalcarata]
MHCYNINLNQTEDGIASLNLNEQSVYQPRTLHGQNNGRYADLPIFPTKCFGPIDHLLLANVPVTRLGPTEITRRQHGAYTSDALEIMNNYQYGNIFSLSKQDTEELATRLQIGTSIITFNADVLRRICYLLLALYESFRENILCKIPVALNELFLNSKQMSMLLEFYLQIDVDTFHMKTCSFRGATPRSLTEGLFCDSDKPQARYTLTPCGNLTCPCCHPINNDKKSQMWPVVDFNSSSTHDFVNGYTTYLNCPATCTTSNVIYTMTCPCGHYDYVDSTAKTLSSAMIYHREHGNRRIHEKLTGTSLLRGAIFDPNENENTIANKMRLYQHSARCPIALRSFLDCNPTYWCFIPLVWSEAVAENDIHWHGASNIDPTFVHVLTTFATSNRRVARSLERVPLPPGRYAFSHRQVKQQRLFFEQFHSSPINQLPYMTLDLYKMAIIAVLPEDHSIILRYIIETLFIIHGETKLNMICPVGGDAEKRFGRAYNLVWCVNLKPTSTQ